jgi:hypothetical protein
MYKYTSELRADELGIRYVHSNAGYYTDYNFLFHATSLGMSSGALHRQVF